MDRSKSSRIVIALALLSCSSFSYAEKTIPLQHIREFSAVFEIIKNSYVKEIDDQELFGHAIRGMLNGLDPHSNYLEPNEYGALRLEDEGHTGGIGVTIRNTGEEYPVITHVELGSPAHRVQLLNNDQIVSVEGESVSNWALKEVVNRVRGEIGTAVKLTISREVEEESQALTFELIRDSLPSLSIQAMNFPNDIAYLRFPEFQRGVAERLRNYVQKWHYSDSRKGLLLDLRDNPGGFLSSAIKVVNLFLENGTIVSTKGREGEGIVYRANPGVYLDQVPIVILQNGGTASAAEIVAGALKDHKRAVIVGTRSFGKGSVQSIMALAGGGALKLTTDLYYTPSGNSIQAVGIQPDVEVQARMPSELNTQVAMHEADIPNHLPNSSEVLTLKEQEENGDAKVASLLEKDNQLREAYNILLGLSRAKR